jgi:SAM-dependent methyltransferase
MPSLETVEQIDHDTSGAGLEAMLAELYRRQLAIDPTNGYMIEHGAPRNIAKQVATFLWYESHLPRRGSILDWGCNHAPDSCLLRASFGDDLDLHGCDFADPLSFEPFHNFAELDYMVLDHAFRLPYADETFDAVIGSGVLEHVAMDGESLKEVYRVLKPEGRLIITHLPNWLSYEEFLRRHGRRQVFHRRLYGIRETCRLLKHWGFYPICRRYHTFIRERFLGRLGLRRFDGPFTKLLYRLLPVNVFSSTLCFVAEKVKVM